MKRKIVGIVVLMLVATIVVSATNINVKEKIRPQSKSVDVPVWKKGDTWTYNFHRIEYRYTNTSTLWYKQFYNCSVTLTVSDDSGADYIVKIVSKNNEGRSTIGSYQLKYTKFTKFIDEIIYRKTDLGQLRETFQWKGPVFWLIGGILPIPAQFQLSGTQSMTPVYVNLPFPFNAGDSGTLPGYSGTITEKCTLYWGLITLFNHPNISFTQGGLPYQCDMANVTVPAGIYNNTYNVSVDVTWGLHGTYSYWQYYVPDVGNTIKWSIYQLNSDGKLQYNIGAELVSTTYTP